MLCWQSAENSKPKDLIKKYNIHNYFLDIDMKIMILFHHHIDIIDMRSIHHDMLGITGMTCV